MSELTLETFKRAADAAHEALDNQAAEVKRGKKDSPRELLAAWMDERAERDGGVRPKLRDINKLLGIDYTTSVLSGYLSGNYSIESTKRLIDQAVLAYFARRQDATDAGYATDGTGAFLRDKFPVSETSAMKKFCEVARVCHNERKMGRATGESGIGKTTAATAYAKRNPGTVLIHAHRRYTTREVFQDICKEVSLEGRGTVHRMMGDLIARLKDSDRLIIIDEAEHLKADTLDEIRRLHDHAGIGILYVGLERFRHQLRGLRGDYEYIVNRIKVPRSVARATDGDVELLVKQVIPKANGLCKVFAGHAKGDVRLLENLVFMSLRAAKQEKCDLTEDIIGDIAEQLRD